MDVILTKNDLIYAHNIAIKRNKSQRDGNRFDGKVLEDSIGIDIQGAEAELAVAKALKLPWDGSFLKLEKWFEWKQSGTDVSGLEVRSTKHQNGCLIIHKNDKDNVPYILVITKEKPLFKLVGWNFGKSAKFDKYWRDVGYGRPCFFLPQSELYDINDLKNFHF